MWNFLRAIQERIASMFCREVFFGLLILVTCTVALFTGHMTATEYIVGSCTAGGISTAGVVLGKATGGIPPTPPAGGVVP